MFAKMFLFEWRYFTRQPSFYISALLFFSVAVLFTTLDKAVMGGGNILKNGTYSIAIIMLILGAFAMFLVVNFVANTAMRNETSQMSELLYSKPIKPLSYQLGRFLGAYAVVITVFIAVPSGLLIGSFMPWADATRFGPTQLSTYLLIFIYYSVPTLFVISCLFYSLAIRFRSMMVVYLTVIVIFILNEITGEVFSTPDTLYIGALLDPFAMSTFLEISRYWSISEKNTAAISLDEILIQNRLLWISIGVITVAVFGRFNQLMAIQNKRISQRQKRQIEKEKNKTQQDKVLTEKLLISNNIHFKSDLSLSIKTLWLHFTSLLKFEVKAVIFNSAFLILSLITAIILLVMTTQPMGMFGTSFLPFTQNMINYIGSGISMMVMIVITYYSAEVIWREESNGIGDIVNSLPVSNLTFWLAKLVAVWCVLLLLITVSALVTIAVQQANGFVFIDLPQYFVSLFFFSALPWMMYAVLAFLLQVISPNKYIGMLLFVIFIGSRLVMAPMGLEHHMFQFAQAPALEYSDINGYGWLLESQSWYMAYWGALTIILALLSYGLWQRGTQQKLKTRFRLLGYQIGKSGKITLAVCLMAFILTGGNIIYNTRYLNQFVSAEQAITESANYEKEFKQFADLATPVITAIKTDIELFPEQRKINAKANFNIINASSEPISRFLITMPDNSDADVKIKGGKLANNKGAQSTYWFEFSEPLLVGESRKGEMTVTKQHQGFVDNNADVSLVKNGTFLNNNELFPIFGYQPMAEIQDRNDRKTHGLPPPQRAFKREDKSQYHQTIMGHNTGYIDFEATLSTSIEQIAIAPGYLQKKWIENDRQYFHYKMDAPIQNYYSIMSAKLNVTKEKHNGITYEVYYHPDHGMNVPIMLEAMKDSVDYFGKNFGPYQHRQARIIEFPGYRVFAQSFPNTIAFSEKIGFINDTSNPDEINSVYYVTAHEMAHQWWGGQVNGANVQGSTMISETMAQYSALMLTRQKFGDEKIRGILKFELDRYLRERSLELIEEQPLARAENQQYIHYRKGSVIMMSLLDVLGEARMNNAFAAFIEKYKFSQKTYPITTDLIALLNSDTTTEEKAFIHDAFEEIYLYSLIAKQGKVEKISDELFEVTFTANALKLKADGQGVETETDFSEMIEIGLFSEDPDDLSIKQTPIYKQKHLIKNGENIIKIKVATIPKFAGIDPYIKLIDRDTADNIIAL